jgi:hypothetical protein
MPNVFVRIALYNLGPLIAMVLALIPGWGISYADGAITIDLETVLTGLVGGLGLSSAIFARWGKK